TGVWGGRALSRARPVRPAPARVPWRRLATAPGPARPARPPPPAAATPLRRPKSTGAAGSPRGVAGRRFANRRFRTRRRWSAGHGTRGSGRVRAGYGRVAPPPRGGPPGGHVD